MAVIMISELPGAGSKFADIARQQGLFDKMKSAPGFMEHWSGATDTGCPPEPLGASAAESGIVITRAELLLAPVAITLWPVAATLLS